MKHVNRISRIAKRPAKATSLLVKQEQVDLLGEFAVVLAAYLDIFAGLKEAQD